MMNGSPRLNGGQFQSTRKWNEMLERFCEEVPLNANRRHWRTFPNSFSGRSAIDAMHHVLSEVFPEKEIERDNARRVLTKLLNQGLIVGVHRSENEKFKDESSAYYKFGKQLTSDMDKYMSRAPRRSVSVDGNRQRFAQPRMSVIAGDHLFTSEPSISHAPSLEQAVGSSVSNSSESIDDEEAGKKLEINAAALRFLQWLHDEPSLDEQQRRNALKTFKVNYPRMYGEFKANPRKSASTVSAPQFVLANQQKRQQEEREKLAASSVESAESSPPSARRSAVRLSEADLNERLLEKLDAIVQDTKNADRARILKYFRRVYPNVYQQRFPSEQRQLLKKLREFLPKLSEVR